MKNKSAGLIAFFLAGVWLLSTFHQPQFTARSASMVEPTLESYLNSLPSKEQVQVIVILNDQVDVTAFRGNPRSGRLRKLILALQHKADGTQGTLRQMLNGWRRQGLVQSFTRYGSKMRSL